MLTARQRRRSILLLGLLLVPLAAFAEKKEIFHGVTYEEETLTAPRPVHLYWLEADLDADGVKFEISPPEKVPQGEVTACKPPELIKTLGWQAILNGDAFDILGKNHGRRFPDVGDLLDLTGADAHAGQLYSHPRHGFGVFFMLDDGAMGVSYPPLPKRIKEAVGGFRIVLEDGEAGPALAKALHPRSVIGCNREKNRLYWLVVDGRQSGISEGATEGELSEWMKKRGARDALSLDGGGSSILVIMHDGKPEIINHPVGEYDRPDTVRAVGNCVGIKANALHH